MKCSKCGKDLPNDALFCNSCGTRIELQYVKDDEPSQESKWNQTIESHAGEAQTKSDDIPHDLDTAIAIPSDENDSGEAPKKKDRTVIWILLIICAIGLGIKGYTAYLNKKNDAFIREYAQGKYGHIQSSADVVEDDFLSTDNDKIQQEMEDAAKEYDKELPEEIGYGMTMLKCSVEGKSMVYTIQWEGMSPSDFTSDAISELKYSFVEGIKEDGIDPMMKALTNRMSKYGYDFIYRFVNENGEQLCSINISPSDYN